MTISREDADLIARRRVDALSDYSPDGGLPEHKHHIVRRGLGGRPLSLATLPTMGVSAALHQRIHNEGDSVLDDLPERPTLASLW